MSAISADWAPTEPETRGALEVKRSREEVFHSALESYIASYQKRHATAAPVEGAGAPNTPSNFWFPLRLMRLRRS